MGFLQALGKLFGGAAAGTDYYNKQFGLAPGETITGFYTGGFAVQTGTAEGIALDLVQMKKRGKQISCVLTNQGRASFGLIEGDLGKHYAFSRGEAYAEIVGDGGRELAGPTGLESTKIVRLSSTGGELFRVVLPASGAQQLAQLLS